MQGRRGLEKNIKTAGFSDKIPTSSVNGLSFPLSLPVVLLNRCYTVSLKFCLSDYWFVNALQKLLMFQIINRLFQPGNSNFTWSYLYYLHCMRNKRKWSSGSICSYDLWSCNLIIRLQLPHMDLVGVKQALKSVHSRVTFSSVCGAIHFRIFKYRGIFVITNYDFRNLQWGA